MNLFRSGCQMNGVGHHGDVSSRTQGDMDITLDICSGPHRYPYKGMRALSNMVRKIENISEKSNLSPLGIRLLTYLGRHPLDEFYTKKLAGEINASVSGCHTALAGLLEDNLVVRRKEGGNVYWKANMENPSLRSFKVFRNIQQMRGIIDALMDVASQVVLFGSCATGEDTHRSDIDLMVVTNETEQVAVMLRGVHVDGRPVSPIILTPSRLLDKKEEDRALYDEVRGGMILWGGDHH